MRNVRYLLVPLLLSTGCATVREAEAPSSPEAAIAKRPFGTLREQAERQQRWLDERIQSRLPELMRAHGVDMWVVPMREYNEDPVFKALVGPNTFAARRRTIYVFSLREGAPFEKLALGGGSQGGVYETYRSRRQVDAGAGQRRAELWGAEQWQLLKEVLEERQPQRIGINVSRTFAFSDGLTHGEYEGMAEALGPEWVRRLTPVEGLAVDLLAWRSEDEGRVFEALNQLAWDIIQTAFSNEVITPGKTRTSDVVWWMRQRVTDLGLETWFQPSVSVQRQGVTEARLGEDPVIERGDVLHCDFGLMAMRLNTDTQHMGYVLREGETDAPEGLKAALRNSNRLQDLTLEELRPGRKGNDVLRSVRERMRQEQLEGTLYSHPIGLHGHGAGAMIGLWDRQEGVPGAGDLSVLPSMWYSIELQATTPVPEWGNQPVRSAQEEDIIIDAQGAKRWAHKRQEAFHLVR